MAFTNKRITLMVWGALLLALAAGAFTGVQLLGAKATPIAKVTYYTGDFRLQSPGREDWKKAVINEGLASGDKVKTLDQSRGEVAFADGSIIRVDANSNLDIVELKKDKGGQAASAKVWSGKVWASVNKMSKKTKFELESPTAVAAVRGTVFRMTVADDKTTKVAVYSGEVKVESSPDFMQNQTKKQGGKAGEIEGPTQIKGPSEVSFEQWVQIVKAQMEITINPDGTYGIVKFDPILDAQDEWVKWNEMRDQLRKQKLGIKDAAPADTTQK
ncbi:MAG TPA: FecR family protein [Candidatus Edwardsbacteria bacterium]|nr:FecR family protein [Candidatus Edwardsbacteria bacterium]